MRMFTKMLAITAIAVIAGTAALYIGSQSIILGSFESLEEQYAQDNIERAINSLSTELSELSSKTADYAEWNDTYRFIQDGNEEYIQDNLEPSTWANLRVDVVVFINTAGEIVFGAVYEPDLTTAPLPQSLLEMLSANDTLWYHPDVDSAITGIVPLPEEPLLIASRPILTNDHQGPIQGTLIAGRFFDSEELEFFTQTLLLPLTLSRVNDAETDADFMVARQSVSTEKPVFVQPLNGSTVAGYALLTDIYENPYLILRATMPRDIYKQGEVTITYFLAAQIITGVVTAVAVMVVLDRYIVSRLNRMATEVKNMGESESKGLKRLSWESEDELAVLAGAIDSMMEERVKAMEQVAAMVGHDMRNPLTGISNASYYLRMKIGSNASPKVLEMLDLIDKDVEYSNKIINDLLEYSREIKLEVTEQTPKAIMDGALALVTVPENIQVVDWVENEPLIKVDADKLKRVFVNIIRNAVDAMPDGGTLTIKSRKTRGKVEVSLADTGVGIPKGTLERLFTPLFTTKARGMGFGLAICKRIIEAHGGRISVESTVGKGTTFTLSIPLEPKLERGEKT